MNTCDSRRGAILIELWRSINSSEPSLKETLTAHTKRICNNTDETLRSIESLAIFPDDLDNALDFVCIFVTYKRPDDPSAPCNEDVGVIELRYESLVFTLGGTPLASIRCSAVPKSIGWFGAMPARYVGYRASGTGARNGSASMSSQRLATTHPQRATYDHRDFQPRIARRLNSTTRGGLRDSASWLAVAQGILC